MLASQVYGMGKDGTASKTTLDQAAEMLNVGKTTVQKAEQIRQNAFESVKEAIAEGTASINRAASALKKAEEKTGIKVNQKTTKENKQKVHDEQDQIIKEEALRRKKDKNDIEVPQPNKAAKSAQDFNDKVLSDVYDGTRYRKNLMKIQEIITKMEQLPLLYNDAYEMVQTREQQTTLNIAIGALIEVVKKVETTIREDDTDFEQVRQALQTLQADKFQIEPHSEDDKREVLETIKYKFFEQADAYIKQAEAVRKKLIKQLEDAA